MSSNLRVKCVESPVGGKERKEFSWRQKFDEVKWRRVERVEEASAVFCWEVSGG
jgi:hypothetical protein